MSTDGPRPDTAAAIDPHVRDVVGTLGADGDHDALIHGPTVRLDASTLAWAPRTLHASHLQDADTARRADALVIRRARDGEELLSGISGAVPVYVADDGTSARFSSRLFALTAGAPVRADWDAWADVLAAGAPLGGKTTVAGVRRLRPWESVHVQDSTVRFERERWPWLDVQEDSTARIEDVADALTSTLTRLAEDHLLLSTLSGGWDSRILAAAGAAVSRVAPAHAAGAHAASTPPVAITTSSDTGIVLEELVAAQVAHRLGLEHTIVVPRVDRFESDLRRFVDAVDHLVRGIVSDPDAVSVRTGGGRRGTVIRVAVSPEDLGRVIGRGGRTASAIRTIVTSVAGPDVRVDVVDTDR